jgi:hypothetical protein
MPFWPQETSVLSFELRNSDISIVDFRVPIANSGGDVVMLDDFYKVGPPTNRQLDDVRLACLGTRREL